MTELLAYVATPTALGAMGLAVWLAVRLAAAWRMVSSSKAETAIYAAANERQANELALMSERFRSLAAQHNDDRSKANAALARSEEERVRLTAMLVRHKILDDAGKALSRS